MGSNFSDEGGNISQSYAARQQDLLQQTLEAEREAARKADEHYVSVDEARSAAALYEGTSQRETTRILFISRDTSLLNPTQQTLDGYLDVSEVFDEVHIVVLRTGIAARTPVLRVADNVWVYVATAPHWWWTPVAAERMIEDQMSFASGFRPDLIVARDPFECGFVAARMSKKFARPSQVHLLEDITSPVWLQADTANKWRRRLMRYVLPKFASVRTSTDQLCALLTQRFPTLEDIATLPRFNNYQGLQVQEASFDIKDKYRQFAFIILYVGSLGRGSSLYKAIDAARFVLRNPRVGLVVVGDGAARKDFIKRTELLGIEQQVVFERSVEDLISYYKTADVLLVTDETAEADEIVIKGAAAGIPLLITATTLRTDLFAHKESALIVYDGQVATIAEWLSYFLNTVSIRPELALAATQVVNTRLYENPRLYRQKYRQSIESALLVGEYAATTDTAAEEVTAVAEGEIVTDEISDTTSPDAATPPAPGDDQPVTTEPVRV